MVCQKVSAVPLMLIDRMFEIMDTHKGLGLAAPQVGYPIQLFVTHWGEVFINPEVEIIQPKTQLVVEGCLSLPNVKRTVLRSPGIFVGPKAYTGVNAIIIQHEYDHLLGTLITDYPEPKEIPRADRP